MKRATPSERVKKWRDVRKAESDSPSSSSSESEGDRNKSARKSSPPPPLVTLLPPSNSEASDSQQSVSTDSHIASEDDEEDESGDSDSDSDYYSYDSDSGSSDSSDSETEISDSEKYDLENPIENLKSRIRYWSIRNGITLKALSQLLVLLLAWLNAFCPVLHLGNYLRTFPVDARTLLGTNRCQVNIRPMLNQRGVEGEFAYFGLETTLQRLIKEKYFPVPKILLDISVDGIPLFKSSSINFWPIQCCVFDRNFIWQPFPVAIFCGAGKPGSVDEYLEEFVEEVSRLLREGITVDGRHYTVEVRCYICDTPARSFIKCTVGHGGFFCCERCTVQGQTVNKRRVYADCDSALRTEDSFLNQDEPEHHIGISPLTRIPGVRLVASFVLDYMHLFNLGCMRRLLVHYWVAPVGKKKHPGISISSTQANILSRRLQHMRAQAPAEFPRKPRGLAELVRFKATEYRFLLIYVLPVILKKILPKHQLPGMEKPEPLLYKHFLLLHVATRFLCSPDKCVERAEYAKQLYKLFFENLPALYGKDSQIMNMHNLLHAADDVIEFQCPLDSLSSFSFENSLGKMKKKLRSTNKPLAQYCRRLAEMNTDYVPVKKNRVKPRFRLSRRGRITVDYLNAELRPSQPNNFVLLKDGKIVEICEITKRRDANTGDSDIFICGNEWQTKADIFTYPCASSELEEYEISERSRRQGVWKVEDVKRKMVHFTTAENNREKHFAVSILHSSI